MSAPVQSRVVLEAANERLRLQVGTCAPYTLTVPSAFVSDTYAFDGLRAVLRRESLEYVKRCDILLAKCLPPTTFLGWLWGLRGAFVNVCTSLLSYLRAQPPTLGDIFNPKGIGAARIMTRSGLRTFSEERSAWADLLIRAHTLYHNGTPTDQPLVHEVTAGYATDSNTRFQKAARAYKVPAEALIRQNMPKPGETESTHPYLAAARHLTVTSLRDVANKVQAVQEDPCISSNRRDNGAHGDRPFNTLKDLSHAPVPAPSDIDPGTKVVHTLFDCLGYDNSLAKHSGHDMIIWTSYYPELAGQTCESVYYADSDTTFVEVIGKSKATAIYKKQFAWDFTASDIVYVENEDRSAFTVYNVIRYPQPDQLKQVVFLCALQTVNLPYAIVNRLVRYTKGHDLSSVGIETPKRCGNVVLVPRDINRPYTKDILVMSNGTPGCPTASIKYKTATSPTSCATLTTELYDYLKYVNSHAGRGLTVHEVVKRLELYTHTDDPICVPGSAAYCELLRTVAWWGELPNVVYYGTPCAEKDIPVEVESAKAVMAAPKLTENAPGVLAKTPAAMDAYVDEKMNGAKNNVTPSRDWKKISDLILEHWIEGIATETGINKASIQLVDEEEILESRNKPLQRARQVTEGLGPSKPEIGRVENKIEAAHKTGACPRGVQNPAPDISIESGMLGKTLELVLKKTSWYNPGSTPQELSESVTEAYLKSHTHEFKFEGGGVRSVDYTAADEKHCKHSNRITRKFIEYFITSDDKARALRIYDSCFHMPLQVGPKVMSSGWKNASGTGITTVLNTNAFSERELETTVVAMVFRSMEDTQELEPGKLPDELTHKMFLKHLRIIQNTWELDKIPTVPKEAGRRAISMAYYWIGPKFGDDGLDPATPYVDDGIWQRAMTYVDMMDGFERKLETTSAVAEEHVEYLSRIYPCPLRSPSSYCKVEKALDKISVAVNRDRERYILKLRGYWTVDGRTPIVGAALTAFSNLYGIELTPLGNGVPLSSDDLEGDVRRIYEEDRELYMKIAGGPYPWDPNASDEQYQRVAEDYGMTSGELREFDALLASQTTWKGIQSMMVPKKLIDETLEDPLGLHVKADPPGTTRVAAFKGVDPRMTTFEFDDGASVFPPFDAARSEAARRALGL